MRIFLYKCIMELKNGCAICAFLTKIMGDFPFLCANCALRGPNIITDYVRVRNIPRFVLKSVRNCENLDMHVIIFMS